MKPCASHEEVNAALWSWRQGDCIVGQQWFVHRIDSTLPLTDAGRSAANAGVDLAEQEVAGLVVVTQTCDIVRDCRERPWLEVCPLVEVPQSRLHEIERGYRPACASLPALASRRLVADLDRTMTIEKTVAAAWDRLPGWSTDAEGRAFAQALARKRTRFAFPDDFSELANRLAQRISGKHDKNSAEGIALRALREIRVNAAPSWDHDEIALTFWFVRKDDEADFRGTPWNEILEQWLALLAPCGRFKERPEGMVVTLPDLTAADYVHSDPLDLDYLSSRKTT